MKKIYLLFMLMTLVGSGFGQSSPGDIAFIAFNADGGDDFAFVTLVDIPANAIIYFTDNEWNGTAFNDLGEGEITWTNANSQLDAGSVVVFTDPQNGGGSVNIGSHTGNGWNLNASNEWIYALLSEPATSYGTSPTFLAAFASDAGSGWLTGTGLTESTNALDFNNDHDGFKYTGSRSSQVSFSDYLTLIMNTSNWQDETSNGELILPISTTAFTITGGTNPTITLSVSSLTGYSYVLGNGPSTEQIFTVEGSNLTADIIITPPADYEISIGTGVLFSATNPITLTPITGTVSSTTIYTRLKSGLAVGDYNGEDITATSTDATTKTVTCSGYVYEQIDWANLQWPGSGTIALYDDYNVYAQVYEPGITDAVGQGAGITVWIGYSTSDTDPSTWTDWVSATYLGDEGNNDEYIANLGADITSTGTYYYASRFQLNTVPYVYGGFSGGFWDGTTNVSGELTVEALPQIDWANLQSPENGNINVGDNFDVYAQVYELGVTDAAGQGVGISAWIGYSISDTDPSSWTDWIPASYNTDVGNNDEYKADISSLLPSGTYYYASRFQLGLADYVYGGYNGGFWDGTTNVSGVLTINIIEPTNHPTGFNVTETASSTITVGWTDAVPFAESYVIKGSNVSYASIVDPVDGVEESNGLLVQNVGAGIETCQFTGLSASTEYYFKIYPYNGTGVNIDYKTDGTVPTANGTTTILNTNLYFSEVADPSGTGSHDYRFVELVNSGSSEIDFASDTWYFNKQSNGGAWSEVKLSGTIASGGVFVIAADESLFLAEYNFSPNQESNIVSSNGNDGYFLTVGGDYDNDGATIVDAYGVVDQDGTGTAWEFEDSKAVRIRSVSSPNSTWTDSEWDVPSSASRDDMTPSKHKEDITWQGTTDSDWNTKGTNWSGTYGYIPDASFNVTIPATGITNYPAISAEAACNSLTIQSTSGGDGSLLGQAELTAYGTVTAQRYISNGVYHGICSPLAGAKAQSLYSTTANVYLKYHTESSNAYTNVEDLDYDLGDMKGFMMLYAGTSGETFDITGTLRTGTIGSANNVTRFADGNQNGWNLVGNPFPSAIDWNGGAWTKTNVGSTYYVYNGLGNWASFNGSVGVNGGSQYIAMGQGFFVEVVDGETVGTLTMDDDVQVHNSVGFMKNSAAISELVRLELSNGEYTDETVIYFDEEATAAYDYQHDAHKLFSFNAERPQIYSTANNNMSINVLPVENTDVPFDVRGSDGENMTIAATEVMGFGDVMLLDNANGELTNLMNQDYEFLYSEDITDRFLLLFTTVGTDELDESSFDIYSVNSNIRVDLHNQSEAEIVIYNLMGQKLTHTAATGNITDIQMFEAGCYIVKVISDNKVETTKVIIN